jgi:hypothetical protein
MNYLAELLNVFKLSPSEDDTRSDALQSYFNIRIFVQFKVQLDVPFTEHIFYQDVRNHEHQSKNFYATIYDATEIVVVKG